MATGRAKWVEKGAGNTGKPFAGTRHHGFEAAGFRIQLAEPHPRARRQSSTHPGQAVCPWLCKRHPSLPGLTFRGCGSAKFEGFCCGGHTRHIYRLDRAFQVGTAAPGKPAVNVLCGVMHYVVDDRDRARARFVLRDFDASSSQGQFHELVEQPDEGGRPSSACRRASKRSCSSAITARLP